MPRPRNKREPDHPTEFRPALPAPLVRMIEPALPKTAQVYDVIRRTIVGLAMLIWLPNRITSDLQARTAVAAPAPPMVSTPYARVR